MLVDITPYSVRFGEGTEYNYEDDGHFSVVGVWRETEAPAPSLGPVATPMAKMFTLDEFLRSYWRFRSYGSPEMAAVIN
jgi:hypothetical protein